MQTTAAKNHARPPAKRRKLGFPIPGCITANISKLADHIKKQHPKYTTEKRHNWLDKSMIN